MDSPHSLLSSSKHLAEEKKSNDQHLDAEDNLHGRPHPTLSNPINHPTRLHPLDPIHRTVRRRAEDLAAPPLGVDQLEVVVRARSVGRVAGGGGGHLESK